MVEKHSRERRWAADFSQQSVFIRRISSGDLHCRPLALCAHGKYLEVFQQRGFASGVHHTRGCPDLCVAVCVDVVHQKIDQPAPCLQHR
jgi:hypothetical protein